MSDQREVLGPVLPSPGDEIAAAGNAPDLDPAVGEAGGTRTYDLPAVTAPSPYDLGPRPR